MKVTAYKTPLIKAGDDLYQAVAHAVPSLPERSVLAVASKVVSTAENRFVPKVSGTREEKFELVKKEADFYTDPHSSKYGLMLTLKGNWMFMSAGIDESNADNQYILWPENLQNSANTLWQFVREHYGLKEVGVIITDSSSLPRNWGVIGHAIAYCGFWPLHSYIGQPDLFGRPMKMEQLNIMQCVASAAVLEMGEGNESTPFAVAEQVRAIEFQDHAPTEAELKQLRIESEDDAYAPLLKGVEWKKGTGW